LKKGLDRIVMQRVILRRLALSVPVLLGVALFSFLLIRLQPNGPFDTSASGRPIPANVRQALESRYGLDKPVPIQFIRYLGNVVRGDLGPMMRTPSLTVRAVVADSLPVTLQLGGLAIAVGLVTGLTAGILAAVRIHSPVDHLARLLAVLGVSVPTLALAPGLVILFGLKLKWLPIAFWGSRPPFVLGVFPRPTTEFWLHAALPVLTLGVALSAIIARLTRASLMEILNQDYIRTARAKGVWESMVVLRHALKNGLIPVVTILGPLLVTILPGAIVVENIFGINGLGRNLVESAFDGEYFLLSSSILVFAVIIVAGNLAADIVYAWLDPRIAYTENG
jgi:oligopeptide transport system permease protein